jgi:hypothetical protein
VKSGRPFSLIKEVVKALGSKEIAIGESGVMPSKMFQKKTWSCFKNKT